MFKQLVTGAKRLALGPATTTTTTAAAGPDLFTKVSPDVDGEDCLHDCSSCTVHYPRGFKIEEHDELYGHVKGWATHVLVATGKSDWVRDVADEKGSVMEALDRAEKPSNGRLMLSATNMPTPHHTSDYSEPTTVLLLPAFTIIDNVTPAAVPTLVAEYINKAPTNTSALTPIASTLHPHPSSPPPPSPPPHHSPPPTIALAARPSPHSVLILLCSQKTRDARCGQSAPLLRKELERHLRPLGLFRDLDDERPGGVGIYFISHTGGHKYSANMMVYRRPDAFGVDGVRRAAELGAGEVLLPRQRNGQRRPAAAAAAAENEGRKEAEGEEREQEVEEEDEDEDVGAAQCIWLARVKPEDIEGIVKFTVLQGKVVKPESQLRGGFDRAKGLLSW